MAYKRGCHDCLLYGQCGNEKSSRDYICNHWEWRYAGSWFDN